MKNFFAIIFLLTILTVCLMPTAAAGAFAFAEDSIIELTQLAFDDTNVLEDLQSSDSFDIADYPFDMSGVNKTSGIINFVEYCYSYRPHQQDNYALYVYFYNPLGLEIIDESPLNKIEMAVDYDEENNPTGYQKFSLQYCNKSEGDYFRLFYKYRVVIDKEPLLARLNSNARRYDVSGIEFFVEGQTNAREYNISLTYIYTGYNAGYGPDSSAVESTVSCSIRELETVELEINHTNFLTGVSSLGANHYNSLSSVYFSVPNYLHNDYGKLQRIKAEWEEYKTKEIVTISDAAAYNYIKNYIGQTIERGALDYRLYYGKTVGYKNESYAWSWNIEGGKIGVYPNDYTITTFNPCDTLYYVFPDNGAGYVPHEILQSHIRNYSGAMSDLFLEGVDAGRTKGYNVYDFDIANPADYLNLFSYDSNHSGWEKFFEFFWQAPPTGGDYMDIAPIYTVEKTDIYDINNVILSDAAISERLFIAEKDVPAFKSYYTQETAAGRKVYLLRFANTDQYRRKLDIIKVGADGATISDKAYLTNQTVFLDFDVIQLTFNKDGVYKVIAAVCNPIDVIADVVAPPAEEPWIWEALTGLRSGLSWWRYVLMAVAGIILLIILLPLLPYIIKLVIWVLMLPVRLIKAIVKAIKKGKKRSRARE